MNDIDDVKKFIDSNPIAVLYFSTNTCGACIVLKNKIIDLLKGYEHTAFYEIPEKEAVKIAPAFDVYSFPAAIIYVDGREVSRKSKYTSIDEIREIIDRYYSLYFEK